MPPDEKSGLLAIGPSTHFRAPLASVLTAVVALLSAASWVSYTYLELRKRLETIDSRMEYMVTTSDIVEMKVELGKLRTGLAEVVVECPRYAVRGTGVVRCKVIRAIEAEP